MININDVLAKDEYSFINTNEHLGENIMFLTFGGSHAYGTNIPTSDIDVRGVALDRPSDIIGLSNFEQFINNETDTTIYGFRKLINLIINCNPNTIEMLGCKPDSYAMVSDAGKMLLDNKHLFLSKKAIKSFGGYAMQQLRRLQNAIARDSLTQSERENHILISCKSASSTFPDRYEDFDEYGKFELFTAPSSKEGFDTEIFANINLTAYPVRDFNGAMSEIQDTIKNYDKLNKRNDKKDTAHLNKHAMHLVRLYLMCLDILEKKEINTYRENDIPMLMSIRNGAYANSDGTYKQEFFELVNEYEKRMKYAAEHTDLPEKPDYHKIEELVMTINMMALSR